MKIFYLYNSGFLIETDVFDVLIDYYRGDFTPSPGKKLYIFASHAHGDHYNKKIWDHDGKNTVYLLSSDIKHKDAGNIIFLKKGGEYTDDNLSLRACGSTDAGISFLFEIYGKTFFHAGDFNFWHWKDESTPEEIKEAEDFFNSELNYIYEKTRNIDYAFFPLDPRLGEDYWLGADRFIKKIKTSHLIPMHFGENYEQINKFIDRADKYGTNFINIDRPGLVYDSKAYS